MWKFPPELIVQKGNVFYLLYVFGGLLMTVTAGSQCVEVAIRTAQNPANLLRLSNTLVGLMGLRDQIHVANSVAKRKLKRLFFTDSFNSLLEITRTTLQGTHHFQVLGWFPEKQTNLQSANCISIKRCRTYYILICVMRSQPVLTLNLGNNNRKLNMYNPSNQLQWLINFSSQAQAQGDVIFLLLGGQTGGISTGSDTNGATTKRPPTSLTLGLSALCVVLLWMFLPHIAVFSVICLGWKVKQHIH
ncbi:uncharacterized protein LOC131989788 [Centropristis striata]|uniref:uncharacterized protein LOC131989788 n=1 Tax=Centropristis striata TaxID=184440 RepID=UPI0027E070A5|nr:uncharacterized protein LOC131989788 [Centropristis striata]